MDRLTNWAIAAWRRTPLSRRPRFSRTVACSSRGGVPDSLNQRELYLIGQPAKWAILACPCGTGHTIDLNLANPQTTQWQVEGAAVPTLHPSIDVRDPTGRCHFWLRGGRVHWVQPPRTRPNPNA